MKELMKPIPIAALVIGLALLVLGQYPLAVVVLIAWIGSLAIGSMRHGAVARTSDPAEALDPDGRARFARVRRLAGEIEEIVRKHADSAVIRTVGREAEAEANRIRNQVAAALVHRGELRRALVGRSTAEMEISHLEEKHVAASNDDERSSLESALDARRLELAHYTSAEHTLATIDGSVRQAEAALSEMKARLEVGVTGQKAAAAEPMDDLRETIGRMKALSVSYDEAEQVLGHSSEE